MDTIKKTVNQFAIDIGVKEPEHKSDFDRWSEEFDQAVTLSRTTRVYGAIFCFCLGWILSIASVFTVAQIATGHPKPFAIFYTLGNVLSLGTMFFIAGPCKQLQNMFKPVRAVATLIYLLSIGLTLFVAFKVGSALAVFACMIFQFLAMVWYIASYVPYGRQMLKNCVGSMCTV